MIMMIVKKKKKKKINENQHWKIIILKGSPKREKEREREREREREKPDIKEKKIYNNRSRDYRKSRQIQKLQSLDCIGTREAGVASRDSKK